MIYEKTAPLGKSEIPAINHTYLPVLVGFVPFMACISLLPKGAFFLQIIKWALHIPYAFGAHMGI